MEQGTRRPRYLPRREEDVIRDAVREVAETGQSRALLVYGEGGIGKTSLVRGLARAHRGRPEIQPQRAGEQRTAWLEPVDVDDPEYWLLSTLEQQVARQLDPDGRYFRRYLQDLSRLPAYQRSRNGPDQVISHLGRVKRVFAECYTQCITQTRTTVVMTFDTVEAMRGNYLLYTLTQWMKSLPGTLFVLSGRPMQGDPIQEELEDPHQPMPVTVLELGPFDYQVAEDYLRAGEIGSALAPAEIEKLALLTRAHPLWLAFATAHIVQWGLLPEMLLPLDEVRRLLPYGAEPSREGLDLYEEFKRHLMVPYRDSDFWHEAVKRLAVVRQGMNQQVWERLMSDQDVPPDAGTLGDAWQLFKDQPWVRSRANGHHVTLHDAVAEELARRVIPLHDMDQTWRRDLWERAAAIYSDTAREEAAELNEHSNRIDGLFQDLPGGDSPVGYLTSGELVPVSSVPDASSLPSRAASAGNDPGDEGHEEVIASVVEVDALRRSVDQLRVVAWHYQLLSEFETGTRQFLELFSQARRDYDVFLQDRLALEMQRFLPETDYPYPLEDIISGVLAEFAEWLKGPSRTTYLEIGMTVGGYLIDNQHNQAALALLARLPADIADAGQRTRLEILRANANMRVPQRMPEAFACLDQALEVAGSIPDVRRRLVATGDVYKEMGFCSRNAGQWEKADHAYQHARDNVIESHVTSRSDSDSEDLASIYTNWAYLKGLIGAYQEGISLVEHAVSVRHRRGLRLEEGISLSVQGEIFRYARLYQRAWDSYEVAEQVFQATRDWSWLGQVYQEQAICLVQALEVDINVVPDRNPAARAKLLITLALDICRDQNVRAYPSALNRAGRIFGAETARAGLPYLEEAAAEARKLSDGWFWFASLVEYVELCCAEYLKTGDQSLADAIERKAGDIREVADAYQFADLLGRWHVVLADLDLNEWRNSLDEAALDSAMAHYIDGFKMIAQSQFGSSGRWSLPPRLGRFFAAFKELPERQRARWLPEMYHSWRSSGADSTVLLANIEQLF
jgi:tetratricopeptide (TPR) repeat protein